MNRFKVILIEDHAMLGQLLGALVSEQLGLELCATCPNVQTGRAAILAHQPDLAIVDWKLPDGRGFDLVRDLGPKLTALRWLFMSASEQGHVVREAVRLGVQGFVQKSADLSALRTAISKLLAGENYYCPASSSLLVEKMVHEVRRTNATLTPREHEILRSFARGQNIKVTADQLGISVKTAQNHLTGLKDKLGLHEPAELVHYAIKHGYIEAP